MADNNFLDAEEVKVLAKEYECSELDICIVCGQQIKVQIFRWTGVCCDNHRKLRDGDDKSPYPFFGDPTTGAP